jgi:hypothetical protein
LTKRVMAPFYTFATGKESLRADFQVSHGSGRLRRRNRDSNLVRREALRSLHGFGDIIVRLSGLHSVVDVTGSGNWHGIEFDDSRRAATIHVVDSACRGAGIPG